MNTLFGLPPPLRGRVGERGKPRTLAEELRRYSFSDCRAIEIESGAVAVRLTAEQAAPLSRALPRKGGGNPSGVVLGRGVRLAPLSNEQQLHHSQSRSRDNR